MNHAWPQADATAESSFIYVCFTLSHYVMRACKGRVSPQPIRTACSAVTLSCVMSSLRCSKKGHRNVCEQSTVLSVAMFCIYNLFVCLSLISFLNICSCHFYFIFNCHENSFKHCYSV